MQMQNKDWQQWKRYTVRLTVITFCVWTPKSKMSVLNFCDSFDNQPLYKKEEKGGGGGGLQDSVN